MTRYTLITGASGGIGEALAHLFAKDHHNLILVARSEDKLLKLKERLESNYAVSVYTIPKDLTLNGSTHEIYQETLEQNFIVETLVNNAGTGYHAEFLDSDYDRQMNLVKLNIEALVSLTYLFGQSMKTRGYGRILNVSSLASLTPGPYMSVYYASKAFVSAFSEGLKEEFKGSNISITTLNPGPTSTSFQMVSDLQGSNMFKRLRVAHVKDVALVGYRGLKKKKTKVYYGFSNKVMVVLSRLTPTYITRKFAMMINGKPSLKEEIKHEEID